MPSKSTAQRNLMGAALSAKRGGKTFPLARKIAGQMSENQLKDFAVKPVVAVKPAVVVKPVGVVKIPKNKKNPSYL